MFILDTNVVSEIRKIKLGRTNANVAAWMRSVDGGELFLSAITVLELQIGMLRVGRRDPRQAAMLGEWLEGQVLGAFEDRILPFDTVAALRCAALHVPDPRAERDAMIAATALVHGMTVVTRNVDDFRPTGVPLLNPWDA